MSAVDVASRVRTGRTTAVEIVTAALERAESAHEQLNAFTLIDVGGALGRAEAIDALVRSGRDPGPLAGVPIALKDIIDDAGIPNTRGASFRPPIPEASATVVRRLGAAGAVIIGRTGLHELAFGFTSENPWFGPVRNPWDPATSAGGSSGGSAAVVASGVTPIAIGTDTGGSVRVPAAMCGIVGLKPSHGRVPLSGVFPLVSSIDTVGPLARTIEDLAVAYTVIAGDDPTDPWSVPRPVETPDSVDVVGLRLGIVRQWLAPPHDDVVTEGLDRFTAACRAAGVAVEDVDVPVLAPPPELGAAIGPEIVAVHGQRLADHPERFGADVARRISAAHDGTSNDLLISERWASAARNAVVRLTDDGFDALIAPTVGVLSKSIGVDTVDVNGEPVFHREAMARFTSPINRMRVPAIAAPVSGTTRPGVSVQLVGPMWSEARLLEIAGALERAGVIAIEAPPIFLA